MRKLSLTFDMNTEQQDKKFMRAALKQAKLSAALDEVPIGAVVVKDGKVIARAHNSRNTTHDAVGHAEVLAIQRACKKLNDWRLTGCTLYVTLEPCVMCLGACYNARLPRVVFGAYDLSGAGCVQLSEQIGTTLNHYLSLSGGVLDNECSEILTEFFQKKRCEH